MANRPDFHLLHDFRVEFSGEHQAFYLFDAENKVIAIFPLEKREADFVFDYIKPCIGFIESAIFCCSDRKGKFKNLYRKMTGYYRKRQIWNRIEKDSTNLTH